MDDKGDINDSFSANIGRYDREIKMKWHHVTAPGSLPPVGTGGVTKMARVGKYPHWITIRNIYWALIVLGRLDCHTMGYVCENALSMKRAKPTPYLFLYPQPSLERVRWMNAVGMGRGAVASTTQSTSPSSCLNVWVKLWGRHFHQVYLRLVLFIQSDQTTLLYENHLTSMGPFILQLTYEMMYHGADLLKISFSSGRDNWVLQKLKRSTEN